MVWIFVVFLFRFFSTDVVWPKFADDSLWDPFETSIFPMSNINIICHVFVAIFSNPGSIPIENLKWSIFYVIRAQNLIISTTSSDENQCISPQAHFSYFIWQKRNTETNLKAFGHINFIHETYYFSFQSFTNSLNVMPKFRRERSEKILSECEACGQTAMGTFITGKREEANRLCCFYLCFVLRYFSVLGSGVYPIISRRPLLSHSLSLSTKKEKHFLLWMLK